MKSGKIVIKVVKIALQVLLYAVLALCLFAVIVATTTKRDENGAKTVFGHQLRIVLSDSMDKCELTDVSGYEIGSLPVETLLLVEVVPTDAAEADAWYAQLKKGDVLTFRYYYDLQVTITHRIVEDPVKKETGGYIIKLEGDNKNSESESERMYQTIDTSQSKSSNYVIGKVVGSSYALGKFIYILKQPVGIVCVVIIPALIVIVMEVVRIVSVLGEEKRKKAAEENKAKEDEIEQLKKQIAALSQAVGADSDEEPKE